MLVQENNVVSGDISTPRGGELLRGKGFWKKKSQSETGFGGREHP